MNFMARDGWTFHILAEDYKTVLVRHRRSRARRAMPRIIAKLGGSVAHAKADIRRWEPWRRLD
jgi:hypothetical protein